jgi:MFS family permease
VGLYIALLAAGFAAGPLVLSLTGTAQRLPFAIGVGATLVAAATLCAIRAHLPALGQDEAAPVGAFFARAPTLLVTVAGAAAFEQAVLAFLPSYGMSIGLSTELATGALAALSAGNIVAQLPLGWAADRFGRRGVLVGCALVTLLGSLLLPWLLASATWRFPYLFLWGAAAFGVYTAALIELGDRFRGAELLAGNAAFSLMWGLGGIAGPLGAGAALDVAGQAGLPAVLATIYAMIAATAVGLRWPTAAEKAP